MLIVLGMVALFQLLDIESELSYLEAWNPPKCTESLIIFLLCWT
jgi:hypothetical protein